jgi:CRISPR system Cascade subunit CasE
MAEFNAWLSRVALAPSGLERPFDSYALHRIIWDAFPGRAKNDRPFLYRTDYARGATICLVQSSVEPTWNDLNGALRDLNGPKRFAIPLDNGRTFRFFLRANPVKARKNLDSETNEKRKKRDQGKRVPIYAEADLRCWLDQQAERNGFAVLRDNDGRQHVRLGKQTKYKSYRQSDKRQITHFGVDFEGLLRITDAEVFARAIESGIGRAKAFGFGLVSLAPV